MAGRVILVHLRRPSRHGNEARNDPFWEFGSFGCTGCHRKNLMNPRRILALENARLGFAQGGPAGMRLVHLTPAISVIRYRRRCELVWKPHRMPFRYNYGPILIGPNGETDFPLLRGMIAHVDRTTWISKFSSAFRSRRQPVPAQVGRQIIRVFDARRRKAPSTAIASQYWHALPWAPPRINRRRKATLDQLRSVASRPKGCRR